MNLLVISLRGIAVLVLGVMPGLGDLVESHSYVHEKARTAVTIPKMTDGTCPQR